MEAKFALQDQVNKLTSELSASKSDISKLETRCGELERKEEELTAKLSRQHEELHGVIQNRDDALLVKDESIVKLEHEIATLKDCVLNVAEEGFNQAVRQAVLLYGVPLMATSLMLRRKFFKVSLFLLKICPTRELTRLMRGERLMVEMRRILQKRRVEKMARMKRAHSKREWMMLTGRVLKRPNRLFVRVVSVFIL